ncbi:hypothetical protein AGMMS49975_16220 [Clostridia bacterium]|nr:hypothetical protein AGMMS49975_16220 [Clostridia bacterium]
MRNGNRYTGVVLAIVVLLVFFVMRNDKLALIGKDSAPERSESVTQMYDEIANLDLEKNYPQTALELVELNSEIRLALYCGKATDIEIAVIYYVEDKLFCENLREKMPYEKALPQIAEKIKGSYGQYLEKYEIGTAKYTDGGNICTVYVKEYTLIDIEGLGKTVFNNIQYELILEDGKWKILSWESAK